MGVVWTHFSALEMGVIWTLPVSLECILGRITRWNSDSEAFSNLNLMVSEDPNSQINPFFGLVWSIAMCFGKNCKSDLKYFKNSCFFGQVRKTSEAPTASHIWLSDHFEYSKFASWHCLKVGMCVISLTPIRWELHYKVWGQLTNSKIQIFQNSHAIIDFFGSLCTLIYL